MIFGITFNATATSVYYYWLREADHGPDHLPILFDSLHVILWWTGIVLLAICIPLFILTVSMDPGYLRPVLDYEKLVEEAISLGLHLDNLCSYCEVIKS